MADNTFEIERTPDHVLYAEANAGQVRIARKTGARDETVLVVSKDALSRLVSWAETDRVAVFLAGPLAAQIRKEAEKLGLTPQNFVLTAVNAFLEAGQG